MRNTLSLLISTVSLHHGPLVVLSVLFLLILSPALVFVLRMARSSFGSCHFLLFYFPFSLTLLLTTNHPPSQPTNIILLYFISHTLTCCPPPSLALLFSIFFLMVCCPHLFLSLSTCLVYSLFVLLSICFSY